MATELIHSLSSEGTRQQVEALLRSALREPALDELDALVMTWVEQHPGALTALCRDAANVVVEGWQKLDADIAALAARGTLCSALGIDLTGHHEGDGPGLEVSLYSDKSFPFSTSDRAALLAASENDGAAWQGCFEEVGHSLTCTGLEAVGAAMSSHPSRSWFGGGEMPDDYPDYFIALWFVYLRVNQAVAAAVGEDRLPYAMPVLVSEHDFGPPFETVHMADPVIIEPADWGEPPVESDAMLAETGASESPVPDIGVPEANVFQLDAPEIDLPEIDTPEPAPIIDVATAEPLPARGWPWRKSVPKGADSATAVNENPMAQRRRGPGSFASG